MAGITRVRNVKTVETPVRCIDIGGWTDTWFAEFGTILNFSVLSRGFGCNWREFRGIEVTIESVQASKDGGVISVRAADPCFDIVTTVNQLLTDNFDHTNLLLATLYLAEKNLLLEQDLKIEISSSIPPGASLGTSASVSVALIKALTDGKFSNQQIAELAWQTETKVMGGQSGTQDQFAAAYSYPVNLIEIKHFPETTCSELKLSPQTMQALQEGMITVFYGKHNSTETHLKIIKELEGEGNNCPKLCKLRGLAKEATKYLLLNDLLGFGKIMQENTYAQINLHQDLVCPRARAIINLAQERCALGWKINGAGGAGGSITVLFPTREDAERFYQDCQIYFGEYGFLYFEHQFSQIYTVTNK